MLCEESEQVLGGEIRHKHTNIRAARQHLDARGIIIADTALIAVCAWDFEGMLKDPTYCKISVKTLVPNRQGLCYLQ